MDAEPTTPPQQQSWQRPLTILCLHGVRQNASQFKGRLRALQKRLSGMATFVFVDAPYVLPLWYVPRADNAAPADQQDLQQSAGACSQQPQPNNHQHDQQQQQQQQGPCADPQHPVDPSAPSPAAASAAATAGNLSSTPNPKRAWLLSEDLLAAQPQLQQLFSCSCGLEHTQSQHEMRLQLQGDTQAQAQQQSPRQQEQLQLAGDRSDGAGCGRSSPWVLAPAHITTHDQYSTQSQGWEASWAVLHQALCGAAACDKQQPTKSPCTQSQKQQQQELQQQELQRQDWEQQEQLQEQERQQRQQRCQTCGRLARQQLQSAPQRLPHIDGLLGFSQGAAVAAALAALHQQQQQQQLLSEESALQQQQPEPATPPDTGPIPTNQPAGCIATCCCCTSSEAAASQRCPALASLKFVILASGFVSPAAEHQQLLQQQAPIRLPSLHVYAAAGDGGADRQILQQKSEELAALFDPGSRRVLTHAGGHFVPSDAAAVAQMRGFLQQFV